MTARLRDLSLADFSSKLAERTPTPGGGSLAAYLAASGAALCAMAFRFTSGEKFAAVEAAMKLRAEALEPLRARALELVDRDTDAYDAVTGAYKLPKGTDSEKAARKAAIQLALRGALEAPFATMETALAALELGAAGANDVNANLASDLSAGAHALLAGLESAWNNVRINAGSIDDRAHVDDRLAACARICSAGERLHQSVQSSVDRFLSK